MGVSVGVGVVTQASKGWVTGCGLWVEVYGCRDDDRDLTSKIGHI